LKRYETLFIVQSELSSDDITAIIDRYSKIITDMKGTILKVERWGKRKLAYLIRKQSRGFYILIDFAGKREIVAELERILKFDDKVLKYMSVKLADSIVTTPMISLLTKLENAAGGVVITASHNPAKWNGFKIKGEFGGPAHPEMIAVVEKELARVMKRKRIPPGKLSFAQLVAKKKIVPISMRQRYLDDLATKIDIGRIKAAGTRILYDVMHGAGQSAIHSLLPGVTLLHETFNPSFGGVNPEPLAHNLSELIERMKGGQYDLGMATDGDADRIGAVDEKGNFVDSHRVFSILPRSVPSTPATSTFAK